MLDKLEQLKQKWEDLEQRLSDPTVLADQKRFKQTSKEYKDLGVIVAAYRKYKNVVDNIRNNKDLLRTEKDEEFRAMAKEELDLLEPQKEQMEADIRLMLVPKDAEDERDVILEIRSGTGGDEASIFAGDLYRMYTRYIDNKGWKWELINDSPGTAGGYKEVVINVSGEEVYSVMKYESGVHRVQRVPATESQGRIHTSAASVAVMPEADEVDVDLDMKDVKVDTFRSSGAGGQHVNKVESAVRMTHIPTGIVVECQAERSQMKNRESALKTLRTRMYEAELEKRNAEIAATRKTLVSTGDRSAKIRTYNYPQGRITDHRIGFTSYNLPDFMGGNIEEMIQALQLAENMEKLKAGGLA